MVETRKVLFIKETVHSEAGAAAERPVTRAAAIAVFANPLAGRFERDLTPLFEVGRQLGEELAAQVVALLPGPAVSYGKAAVVGVLGDFEHGGALVHPKLGKPMRAAVGGGESVIPSNVKVAGPGAAVDVPLGHKDNAWSFDHFDTLTLFVADAPRPDELMLVIAYADGGRINPRCGDHPG